MERLIFVALVMILFSPLVHAYDYEDQRRRQARDSGQLSVQETKQNQSIKENIKINKQKTRQRSKNRERLRLNRNMGRGNYPPDNYGIGFK